MGRSKDIDSKELNAIIKEREKQNKAEQRGEAAYMKSLKAHAKAMRIAEKEEDRRRRDAEKERRNRERDRAKAEREREKRRSKK